MHGLAAVAAAVCGAQGCSKNEDVYASLLDRAVLFVTKQAEAESAVMSAEEVFSIGIETCEREEAAAREHPEEMNARCDIEGAPFTSWYRRHRNSPLQTAEQIAAQPPRPFSDRTLFGDDAY